MAKDSVAGLVAQLYSAKISRRDFGKRAAAAGLSAGLIGQALAVHATRAQSGDRSPRSGHDRPAGYINSSDTSKGTIKIYSSWPLTGSMEGTGGDAVVAAQMAFDDFGSAAGGYALVYEPLDDGVAANNGGWEAGKETENANKAINDAEAMVLMGTYNSGAAKISIPILNQADAFADGDDFVRQYLSWPDRCGRRRHRRGRAGRLLPERNAQLHARLPGRPDSGWRRGALGIQ